MDIVKIKYVMYKGYKIQTAPFTEEIIDSHHKLCDEVRVLHSGKKRKIKKIIDEYGWDEEFEIVWVHRYPKEKECIIGIKRIKELTYFI